MEYSSATSQEISTRMALVEVVQSFNICTTAQCPQLIKYLKSNKGSDHLRKAYKGTPISRLIKNNNAITVLISYFDAGSLHAMFTTFPVNEMQCQTLQTTPFQNKDMEIFRKFRFEIEL